MAADKVIVVEEEDPEVAAEKEYAKSHDVGPGGDSALLEHVRDSKAALLKKLHKPTTEIPSAPVNGVVNVPRSQKNKRQPRSGKGRGEAKKEATGAGGKFTWGTPGKIYEDPAYLDPNDPNYDSDSQGNVTFDELDPGKSDEEFSKGIEPIIHDYYKDGDLRDTLDSVRDLRLAEGKRTSFVRMALSLACDGKSSVRELASELLSEAVNKHVLWPADLDRAFSVLINTDLPELVVDVPNAAEIMGNFMARAAADLAMSSDVLNDWIKQKEQIVTNHHATAALDQAELMMAQKNRLHDVWGVGGGHKPVRFLARQMQILLQEYLGSKDLSEARRCLHELEVPHFHHELIFQAGVMSIEAMHDRVSQSLATLLKSLFESGELTLDAIEMGFTRLFAQLPEISIDVPPAYTLAERWVNACSNQGFLPANVAKQLPQKGRKRFVSEGDGGRLKVVDVAHPFI